MMNNQKKQHLLVIGGTGMLSQAVLYFASQYSTISVIARHQGGLNRLKAQAGENSEIFNLLAVDYRNYGKLVKKVSESVQEFGDVNTIISWIHSTAPDALQTVCRDLDSNSGKINLFEIVSSERGKIPNYHVQQAKGFSLFQSIKYHSILLGAVKDGSSLRWLTHDEISDGVIDAVENLKVNTIIGMNSYESK